MAIAHTPPVRTLSRCQQQQQQQQPLPALPFSTLFLSLSLFGFSPLLSLSLQLWLLFSLLQSLSSSLCYRLPSYPSFSLHFSCLYSLLSPLLFRLSLFPPSPLFIFVTSAVVGNSKSSESAAVALPQQMATATLDQATARSSPCSLNPSTSLSSTFSSPLSPSSCSRSPPSGSGRTIKSSKLLMRQSKHNV